MINILDVFEKMYPDADCELNYDNVFELLISVMLSAQSTDKSVNNLTVNLFEKYKSPSDYLAIEQSVLENDLRKIGLYKNKAKNIRATSRLLIDRFNGIVPSTMEELVTLPGVGRKTASVVLAVGYNIPAIPVDTHVERVSKRLGMANEGDSVLVVEQKLRKLIPIELWNKSHHQFIFFGRYHCTSRKPKCEVCELQHQCNYFKAL